MEQVILDYLGMLFEDPGQAFAMLQAADRDLIGDTLTRKEEWEGPRDPWGNWEFSFSRWHRQGRTYFPWLDTAILERINLPRRTLWPEGKPFAVCITHDVDALSAHSSPMERTRRWAALTFLRTSDANPQQCARAAAGIAKCWALNRFGRKTGFDLHDLVRFEEELGFRSTFFFIAERKGRPHPHDAFYHFRDPVLWKGRPVPLQVVMGELKDGGWDVGVHGSYNSAVQPGLLASEKAQVEAAIGSEVVSTRQHWLHFEPLVTPDLQDAAGFRVDSTHGFNRDVGFRAGTCFPYLLYSAKEQRPLRVVEVPQHVMDGALFTQNALGCPEDLATAHVLDLMDRVERVGGVLTLSWHPDHFGLHASWRRVFENVLREAKRRNAYGCSLKDLLLRTRPVS